MAFPEYAKRIGEIMSFWAEVEGHMTLVLGYLLHRKVGMAENMIYGLHSSEARILIFEAAGLGFFTDSEDRKNFANCVTTLRAALGMRNELAHAVYAKNNKGKLMLLQPGKDITSQKGARPVSIKSLENTKGVMSLAHSQLNWLMEHADVILSRLP